MKIPIAKPYLTEDEAQNAYDTILSGWVTQGPRVQEFEEKFAEYVGSEYAVAVSSCTTALHLSLIASGIGPGDEVICPSMSFIATANAIVHAGANPVFAEVNSDYNLDFKHVKSLISEKTKAILLVHQIGMPADIDGFKELCSKNNLILIEDAACAVGSSYKGVKIGSHSDLVCFSFHPRKVITTGDGGMITTSNKEFNARLRLLRQHGMSVNDMVRHQSKEIIIEEYTEVGYNYRLTDVQASMGVKQLEKLDWIVGERKKIAQRYNEALAELDYFELPVEKDGYSSNYQSYCVRLKGQAPVQRNDLMKKLLDKGISTRRGIMLSHLEPAYRGHQPEISLPISEKLCANSLLLPLFVPMKDEEITYVINSVKEVLG